MENFWMYQVEKLEEEEAKRQERTESREEDEVLEFVVKPESKFGDVKSLITKTLFLSIPCSFFQHWDCVQ